MMSLIKTVNEGMKIRKEEENILQVLEQKQKLPQDELEAPTELETDELKQILDNQCQYSSE